MSKPEVVAYMWEHRGRHACVDRAYAEQLMDDGEQVAPLIRLTDHERLQAEVERLQAARAADKARIAELTEALGDLLAIVSDSAGVAGYHLNGAVAEWGEFGEIGAAFAALAQQGKDGEA